MRRALARLKYLPAVLCGLLVVVWVVSETTGVRLDQWRNGNHQGLMLEDGAVHLFEAYDEPKRRWPETMKAYPVSEPRQFLGRWECSGNNMVYDGWSISCPILVLLTPLLPLATASVTRFRFPLWSNFAWIALIAAELAYYLR